MESRTRYPMQLGGGVFLICIGFGLVAATGLHGIASLYAVVTGAAVGFAAIVGFRHVVAMRLGRPSRLQVRVVTAAVWLEFLAIGLLSAGGILKGMTFLEIWQVILGVVGLHFIPMRWSHGPWMMGLAVAVLSWIGICVMAKLALAPLVLGDGFLKIAFGAIMAWPLLHPASRAPLANGRSLIG